MFHKSKKVGLAALLVSAGLALGSTPALAQEDQMGAERIAMSAQVRALSQRMALASCYASAGIDVDQNNTATLEMVDTVDKLIVVLENGDPAIGMAKPEGTRLGEALRGIKEQWGRFAEQERNFVGGKDAEAAIKYISRHNLNMMHSSRYLVSRFADQYSIPPALLQSNALTLDIAARQAALSAQIAKESCGLTLGVPVMGNTNRLQNAVRLFERSLNALVNGLPAAGVTTPPNPEIKADLDKIVATWNEVKPVVDKITGPGAIDNAALADLTGKLDAIYALSGEIATLYVSASKKGF